MVSFLSSFPPSCFSFSAFCLPTYLPTSFLCVLAGFLSSPPSIFPPFLPSFLRSFLFSPTLRTFFSLLQMFQSEHEEARTRDLARTVKLNISFLHTVRTSVPSGNDMRFSCTAHDAANTYSHDSACVNHSSGPSRVDVPLELLVADRCIREMRDERDSVGSAETSSVCECWIPLGIVPLLCLHPTQTLRALTSYGVDFGYDNPSPTTEGLQTVKEWSDKNSREIESISVASQPSIISQALGMSVSHIFTLESLSCNLILYNQLSCILNYYQLSFSLFPLFFTFLTQLLSSSIFLHLSFPLSISLFISFSTFISL